MLLSLVFIVLDIISVTGRLTYSLAEGLNPFWKLAFVFKCLCDSIILDDFKTALDRLMRHKMKREGFGGRESAAAVGRDAYSSVGTSDGESSPGSSPTSAKPLRPHMFRGYSSEDRGVLKRMDPLGEEAAERRIAPSLAEPGRRQRIGSIDTTLAKYLGPSQREIGCAAAEDKAESPKTAHSASEQQRLSK